MKLLRLNFGRSIRSWAFALLFLIAASGFSQDPLTNWSEVYPSPVTINSLAYGNGTFVGVGDGFRTISHDGSNWTLYVNAPILNQAAIAYGNGYFLSFGTNTQSPATIIYQSTDGLDYEHIYTNSQSLFAAAFGNNTWVFVGTNAILTATVISSNWNWTGSQPAFNPTCLTYANGKFILGAYLGGSDLVFYSTDGLVWQYLSELPMSFAAYNGIAYGNNVYVATTLIYGGYIGGFGYYYNALINTSSNLVNWNVTCTNLGSYSGSTSATIPIAFGAREFLTSFSSGGAFSSFDGSTWSSIPYFDFITMAFGQGTFVACSGYFDGGIYQSSIVTNVMNPTPANLAISTFAGITINGTAGLTYQIQYTTNLTSSWTAITNFALPYSPYLWIDTSTTVTGQRFYRSVQIQ